MTRKTVVAGALGAAFALLCAGPAFAGLGVSVADAGGNTVSIDSVVDAGGGDWDVGITEDYLNTNSVWIDFEQQGGDFTGDVEITKEIHNGSNVTWRDFHMKLWTPAAAGGWVPSPNDDGLYFTGISATGPFGQVWFNANDIDELWLWDGVWNHCETYTLVFNVGGWGWTGGSVPLFRLEQWPTDTGGPDVPEPATLVLTLAGVAGLVLRRRLAA